MARFVRVGELRRHASVISISLLVVALGVLSHRSPRLAGASSAAASSDPLGGARLAALQRLWATGPEHFRHFLPLGEGSTPLAFWLPTESGAALVATSTGLEAASFPALARHVGLMSEGRMFQLMDYSRTPGETVLGVLDDTRRVLITGEAPEPVPRDEGDDDLAAAMRQIAASDDIAVFNRAASGVLEAKLRDLLASALQKRTASAADDAAPRAAHLARIDVWTLGAAAIASTPGALARLASKRVTEPAWAARADQIAGIARDYPTLWPAEIQRLATLVSPLPPHAPRIGPAVPLSSPRDAARGP